MAQGRLAGRVVFITGAASGIGAALAVESARIGADVVLFDRRSRPLHATAKLVHAFGRRVLIDTGDVTKARHLQRAVRSARRRFGRIDIVVADAGFEVTGRLDDLTVADFRRQFETNVFGVLRTIYATLDDLKRTHGSLVIVGSLLGHLALPGTVAYAMSKFAVTGLAQALRLELADVGVSVTLVSPGNIATNIRRVDNLNRLHRQLRDPIPGWLRMSAERASHDIMRATLHRRSEIILTRLAKVAVLTERLAPRVVTTAIRVGHIHGRREPGAAERRVPSS